MNRNESKRIEEDVLIVATQTVCVSLRMYLSVCISVFSPISKPSRRFGGALKLKPLRSSDLSEYGKAIANEMHNDPSCERTCSIQEGTAFCVRSKEWTPHYSYLAY